MVNIKEKNSGYMGISLLSLNVYSYPHDSFHVYSWKLIISYLLVKHNHLCQYELDVEYATWRGIYADWG